MRLRALVVVLAALVGAPTTAGAEPTAAQGWWWTRQSDGLPLPAPPWVPDDGLYVAASQVDDDGTEAVAALRWALADGTSASSLALEIVSTQGAPVVAACPTTGEWSAEQAAPFERRPEGACDRATIGEVTADGATMTFDVSELTSGPLLDLVLVPVTDGSTSFHVAFAPPSDVALTTSVAGTPASSGGTASPSTVSRPPGPAPLPVSPAPVAPAPTTVATTIAAPARPAEVAGGGPAVAPAVTSADTVGRWLAVVLGALVLGAAVLALRMPSPQITGFGASARPRAGQPPRLR